jgi:hypothetical protein
VSCPADRGKDIGTAARLRVLGERPQQDAGIADAGITDAGITEAGITEACITEAGITEAGIAEAGILSPRSRGRA